MNEQPDTRNGDMMELLDENAALTAERDECREALENERYECNSYIEASRTLRAERDALAARLSQVRDMLHRIVQAAMPELAISDAEFREVALLWAYDAINTIDEGGE